MAVDPRQMRPSELCRLLNSTPLGEVINERQLHRHRSRAGLRIGDGRHVDLLRYVAWLAAIRHAPRPDDDGDSYEDLKERARARNAALSLAGRDIGELPAVANPERKARAASDFRLFCESYFPLTFHLAWSPDHLKVIGKIEQAVLRGGLFAMAMPRGSGKTTLCECACIWAVLNGHREFVCLIGSDEGHAMDMLDSIKMELDGNDLLLDDYPEAVYPIQALDGIANRCNGQLYKGERTHIGWTAREVVLPSIDESKASGAIIKVAGITGRIRGMKYKRADGKTVRPIALLLPAAIMLGIPLSGWMIAMSAGGSLAVATAAVGLLAHLASAAGNRVQAQLYPRWPYDSPTNLRLHPTDTTSSKQQKEKWYAAIQRLTGIDILLVASDDEEAERAINDAAVILRTKVFHENRLAERLDMHNADYGQVRNFAGLRPVWLLTSLASFAVCWITYSARQEHLSLPVVASALLVASILAASVIRPYVHHTARHYADSFFGALDACNNATLAKQKK